MPTRHTRWIFVAVALVAGFLSYLAFRPSGWWFAAPVGLGLLYVALRPFGPWRGFAVALAFGLVQFLPMLTWAYNAAGFLPYLALALTSAVFLALGAVLFAFSRFLLRSRAPSLPDAVLFALSFTAADTFRQVFPFGGFPWGRLGFTQVDGPMAGWAWLGGAPLVGLAAALVGAAAAVALLTLFPGLASLGAAPAQRRAPGRAGRSRRGQGRAGRATGGVVRARRARTHGAGAGAARADGATTGAVRARRARARSGADADGRADGAVAGAVRADKAHADGAGSGGGRARAAEGAPAGVRWRTFVSALATAAAVTAAPLLAPISAAAENGTLRIGAVQGDVEVTAEGLFARQREVLENHVEVSRELAAESAASGRDLDVVLWPENATDIDPRTDEQAYDVIDSVAAELGAPVLVGAMQYVNSSNRYNQGLLWRAGLGVVDIYSKQHPAPFAEYMPARSFFRLFTSKVDLINTDMLPGSGVGVMRFEAAVLGREVALGDIICFEVAYDSLVADVVQAGAEAVVVQTNNASFGFSEESTQQFAMTRLRAIEHGRSTVQISTVGVSAAVAPDGSLLTPLTSLYEPAYFTADLPLRTSITPATRIGDFIGWALIAGPVALALSGLGARLVQSRQGRPTRHRP